MTERDPRYTAPLPTMLARLPRILGQRRTLLGAALLGLMLLLWLAYGIGQLRAGYQRAAARAELAVAEGALAAALAREAALEEQLVRLQTESRISAEAYRQVEERLEEFQATIIAQQEDLAFFRGLVSDAPDEDGIRIQNVVISEGPLPSSYTVQVVLAQPMGRERRVSGYVQLGFEGTLESAPVAFTLPEVSMDEARPERLDYAFRYFQNLEADVLLPPEFAPARLIVRLVPNGRGAEPREQRFEWRPRPG